MTRFAGFRNYTRGPCFSSLTTWCLFSFLTSTKNQVKTLIYEDFFQGGGIEERKAQEH